MGGGPAWVTGSGVASTDDEAWRHRRFSVITDRDKCG